MSKKKVLYLGNFSPKTSYAAYNRALGVLNIFSSLNYEAHILVHDVDLDEISILKKAGIYTHQTFFSKKAFYSKTKYLLKIIDSIPCLSVVVLYNFPSLPFTKILRILRKKHIKVIADVTEWYDTADVALLAKPFKFFDNYIRMHWLNRKCDGLFVISSFLEKFYSSNLVLKIYPLVRSNTLTKNVKKPSSDCCLKIGYCGITGKSKDDLIGFAKKMQSIGFSNFCFEMVGNIDRKTISFFKKNRILFTDYGMLSHDEAVGVLCECDCSVIYRRPTRRNNSGFPTKFSESLSLNMPMIVSNFSDIPLFCNEFIFNVDEQSDIVGFANLAKNRCANYSNELKLFQPIYYNNLLSNFLNLIQLKGEKK